MNHPYVSVLLEIRYQLVLIQKRRAKQPWLNYNNPAATIVENNVQHKLLTMANLILTDYFYNFNKIKRVCSGKVPRKTLQEEIDLITQCIKKIK